jgi:hypothetical protein
MKQRDWRILKQLWKLKGLKIPIGNTKWKAN